ncbi:MAG: hypothetical protein ACKVP4_02630 [Hyphomicrobium sp.]
MPDDQPGAPSGGLIAPLVGHFRDNNVHAIDALDADDADGSTRFSTASHREPWRSTAR